MHELATSIETPSPGSVAYEVDKFLQSLGAARQEPAARFSARLTTADLDRGRIRIPEAAAHGLPIMFRDLEIELLGTIVKGKWTPAARGRRCGAFLLNKRTKLEELVGVGERLAISVTDDGFALTSPRSDEG